MTTARTDDQMRAFLLESAMPIPECGCHIWLNSVDKDGYGQTWYRGQNVRAHRISYLLNVGQLPKHMLVMHRCDVPSCINPLHLTLGTNQENTADRTKKRRHKVASGDMHYMRRNPLTRAGERCPTVKLRAQDVLDIRRMFTNGHTQPQLAQQFGVSRTCISAIVTRRTWPHI